MTSKPDMIVIVPSRGRPQNMTDLQQAWDSTITASTELIIAVDDDDQCLEQYLTVVYHRVQIGSRRRLGGTLNAISAALSHQTGVIGFMGDDHRPRTTGWDESITQALADLATGIAYGNDLIQGAALPTAAFLTTDIIQTLGWMVPPGLQHLYIDNSWRTLGETAGCLCYLPEVIIEHCHPIAGKAEWDDRYAEVNSGDSYESGLAAYNQWLQTGEMMAAANKIKALRD